MNAMTGIRIRIHNVRLGFATNSSSSHSLIFLNDVTDNMRGVHEPMRFGWSCFTLASKAAKSEYIVATLFSQFPNDYAAALAKELFGIDAEFDRTEEWPDVPDVDHQSVQPLPRDWLDRDQVDREFLADYIQFMHRDGLVLLGGNDNGGEHPLDDDTAFEIPWDKGSNHVARKDGDYWTVFARNGGAKVRFSFDDLKASAPMKSSVPELVDIKITDYCTFGCPYCYQGSTTAGRHADMDFLNSLADELGHHRVFEVAIGGGEPTLHPQFLDILRLFRGRGVVPNFTTKNLAWLKDPDFVRVVRENAGGFAFSVESPMDILRLRNAMDEAQQNSGSLHVNLHYVMGLHPQERFKEILLAAREHHFRITLLGYKTTGRGLEISPLDYSWWLDVVRELKKAWKCPTLSIDTVLAFQSEEELKAADVSRLLYNTQDGKFSCYVDAVARTIAPSSYGDPDEYRPFDETWLKYYQVW